MFTWTQISGNWFLQHQTLTGETLKIPEHEVADYVGNLHASERQQPVPVRPADPIALAINDPAIIEAALTRPDPIAQAINEALARLEAAREAAATSAISAKTDAVEARQAALDATETLNSALKIAVGLKAIPPDKKPTGPLRDDSIPLVTVL